MHEGLATDVMTALDAAALPPSSLRPEITESALIEVRPAVTRTLEDLRGLGVLMSYVRHLPLDFVKIDQGFVAGMLADEHDLAMVEATLAMTLRLGLVSVAEGIETNDQMIRLRELGCSEGQGFLFSHPVPTQQVCG